MSNNLPYVKYKGDNPGDIRHKLYKDVIGVSMETITDWISFGEKVTEVSKIKAKGIKGLSYKKFLYKLEEEKGKDTRKFATVNFYKDGKIELKLFYKDSQKASLDDVNQAIKGLHKMVNEINKIQYHLPGVDRKRFINLPDTDFLTKHRSQTPSAAPVRK